MKLFNPKQTKDLLKRVIPLLFLFLPCLTAIGQRESATTASSADSLYVFRYVPGNDMFYIPWQGNDEQLRALCRMVDTHRTAIDAGTLPVQVDSYCASLPTDAENLRTAFLRASRVKSELITHKGLQEADFLTAIHARAYLNNKDMVIVTLRIPAATATPTATVIPVDTVILSETKDLRPQSADTVILNEVKDLQPQSDTAVSPADTSVILNEVKDLRPQSAEHEILRSAQNDKGLASDPSPAPQPATMANPYCLALRTNLLYDAFLLPTLGVEWRINEHVGVRLDGSLSWWGGNADKVQKVWLLNPEARWYLLRHKRFYVGASATYGKYNIYKYPLGSLLKDDTGYQGSLWNAGLTVGYQLHLCHSLSLDFNLGLGYTHSEYDSFGIEHGTRVNKARNKSKSLFGPTQAGITISYRLKAKG